MAKDLAIVLNSGGLNSTVVTALAAQKHRVILLYADTAAKPAAALRAAFEQQVAHFKPYREHVLPMPWLATLRGDNAAAALAADARQAGLLGPQLLHLATLLTNAAAFAAHYQAAAIYVGLRIGSNADDLSQVTEYFQILNELIQMPCQQPELEIHAPLLELESWQVVDVGIQVAAPLERAWSCLEDATDPCGICRGCRSREAAFQQAGKPDAMKSPRIAR